MRRRAGVNLRLAQIGAEREISDMVGADDGMGLIRRGDKGGDHIMHAPRPAMVPGGQHAVLAPQQQVRANVERGQNRAPWQAVQRRDMAPRLAGGDALRGWLG
jgi:hypothetical protein